MPRVVGDVVAEVAAVAAVAAASEGSSLGSMGLLGAWAGLGQCFSRRSRLRLCLEAPLEAAESAFMCS